MGYWGVQFFLLDKKQIVPNTDVVILNALDSYCLSFHTIPTKNTNETRNLMLN